MAEITQDEALEVAQEENRPKSLGELEASFMAGITIARAIVGKDPQYAKVLDDMEAKFRDTWNALLILAVHAASLRHRSPSEMATFLDIRRVQDDDERFLGFMQMAKMDS